MRPHRLRITAFGPFAGTVQVDLDALAAGGLFLLQGETGAGKTTLLDALGFALYGRVPGERGKARRLRSDHADAASRTAVQLEVTIGGRRLRITRSPEQVRPKQRGGGVTTEPAKMLLEEAVGDSWIVRSTRVDEASREIIELMGMSAEQFFSVVLLPQNDFARFLRASSEERGALLERLFGTDRFRRAEDWLAERRRNGHAAYESARARVDTLTACFASVAELEPAADVPVPIDVPAVLAASRRAADEADADVVAGQAITESAGRRAAELRELHGRQRRRAAALARQGRWRAQEAKITELGAELDRARRAAELAAILADADHRRDVQRRARGQERSARRALADFGVDVAADVDILRAAVAERRTRIAVLESLRAVEQTEAAERASARSADLEAAEFGRAAARCATGLAALPQRHRTHTAAVDAAREAEVALPAAHAVEGSLRSARADALALAEAATAVQRLSEEHLAAAGSALDLRQRAVGLRERRIDGMIAELAAALEDGTPCPVCGSLRHPEPSDVRGERVSREKEESAFAAADVAADRAAQLDVRRAAHRATAATLTARLTGAGHGTDAAVLATALATAAETAARLTAAASGSAEASAALDALAGERSALEADRVSLAERQRAAARRAAEAAGRADAARHVLRAELAGAADLGAAIEATGRVLALLDAAMTSEQDTRRAGEEVRRSAAAASTAAARAGFDDVAAARAALREEEWRRDTARRIEDHSAERAAIEDQLADPALAVELEPPADVDGATVAAQGALDALGAAQRRQSVLAQRARALGELAPPLLAATTALGPLSTRAAEARALADLVSGGGANALRMTLTSFVLAARLEEVAAAASERLLRMTQGRYTLVHTDSGRGGARLGLGLLARDAWTGQDRDTCTLSGGETFLASLALALGLADVVTAEAGGAPIEALFVDEGFGTLDEDTLDEVMDVLDGLREGGRVVGVVSHVAELRQRIPSQVQVRKGRDGSDLTTVGSEAAIGV